MCKVWTVQVPARLTGSAEMEVACLTNDILQVRSSVLSRCPSPSATAPSYFVVYFVVYTRPKWTEI